MNQFAKEILELLESHGFTAYIVGGYVRDYLLGIKSDDIDICTNAKIEEVTSFISGKVNEYHSLNIKKNKMNMDITPFRLEGTYLNRKPTVLTYTPELEMDLQRRDFTINTICMNKNGEIIDKLGGRKDLKLGMIRMFGDIKQKITEDPLRILRAIRFATTLDFKLEESLYKEIEENACLVSNLSSYRKKEELEKILSSPNVNKGLELLKKLHLCKYLGIQYKHITFTKDICGMWAQLEILKDFPFTKQEKKNIVKIQEIVASEVINSEIIFEYGLYLSLVAGEILEINANSIKEIYKNMQIYSRKDLNISFQEIKEITSLKPEQIKKVEKVLIKEILNNRLENNKDKLKEYLKQNEVVK